MKSIDFYYDYGSPTAYLAWTQLSKLDKSVYIVNYIPVLLGGIFKATDNKAPGLVIPKAKWMFQDIKMYAKKYNVNFLMNAAFPVNTLYLMRGAIFAEKNNDLEKYNNAFFNAMWAENINLNEPKNIIDVLEANGFDSKKYLEAVEDNHIKDMLKKNTSEAVETGIFGVPSFIVEEKLYFGQDRMHWFLN
tara:strand:+ start:240 stop:809 length:570 start_codon:yes stop_codon:yes gene_type:complete